MLSDNEIKDAQVALAQLIRQNVLTQEEVELLLVRGFNAVKIERLKQKIANL